MNAKRQNLTDRHRPKTVADIVGQPFVTQTLREFTDRPHSHAFVFSGPPGVGKTTAGRALAFDLGCHPTSGIWEFIATDLDDETMDTLASELRFAPMGGGWRLILIDEADYIVRCQKQYVRWNQLLESEPTRTVFVFTTNDPGKFSERFMDRCEHLEFLGNNGATLLADAQELIDRIWQAETDGADGPPPNVSDLPCVINEDGVISFRRVVRGIEKLVRRTGERSEGFQLAAPQEGPKSLWQAAADRDRYATQAAPAIAPTPEPEPVNETPPPAQPLEQPAMPETTATNDEKPRVSPRTGKAMRTYKKRTYPDMAKPEPEPTPKTPQPAAPPLRGFSESISADIDLSSLVVACMHPRAIWPVVFTHGDSASIGKMTRYDNGFNDGQSNIIDTRSLIDSPEYANGWIAGAKADCPEIEPTEVVPIDDDEETTNDDAPCPSCGAVPCHGSICEDCDKTESFADDLAKAVGPIAPKQTDRRGRRNAIPNLSTEERSREERNALRASLVITIDKGRQGPRDYAVSVDRNSRRIMLESKGGDVYEIGLSKLGRTCTCPDWQNRGIDSVTGCKHIQALRLVGIIKPLPTQPAAPVMLPIRAKSQASV